MYVFETVLHLPPKAFPFSQNRRIFLLRAQQAAKPLLRYPPHVILFVFPFRIWHVKSAVHNVQIRPGDKGDKLTGKLDNKSVLLGIWRAQQYGKELCDITGRMMGGVLTSSKL